jgi:hypothetical protein
MCSYAFSQVVSQDPRLHDLLTSPFRESAQGAQARLLAQLREKDPPLGSMLPLLDGSTATVAPVERRTLATARADQRAVLVLMIGSCSTCVLPILDMAERSLQRHPNLRAVAVSPSSIKELKAFRERNRLRLAMVSDADGRLSAAYNAAWRPRAYLLSPQRRLLWCQEGPTPDWEAAIDRLQREGGLRCSPVSRQNFGWYKL